MVNRVMMQATLIAGFTLGSGNLGYAVDPPVCYSVTRLQDQDPLLARAVANSINDKGEVVGHIVFDTEPRAIPFVWSSTTGTRLLPLPRGIRRGSGTDINDDGLVCGWFLTEELDIVGFLWHSRSWIGSRVQILPEIVPQTISNRVDAGLILGGFDPESHGPPLVWINGGITEVTFPGMDFTEGINEINDINDKGVIVGTLTREDFVAAPFRWDTQPGFAPVIEELPGPPGFYRGRALGINNRGDITGSMADLFDESVAYWRAPNLLFQDLGQASPMELVSLGQAINNKRFIVGYSPNDHPLGLDTAWLHAEGSYHDFNFLVVDLPPGVEVYRAWDINDEAQVLVQLVSFGSPTAFDWAVLNPNFQADCPGGTGQQ